MIERLHRQLKAAIKCHEKDQWTKVLPTVLLGIRAAWRENLGATTADLLYGESIRLPGEFLASRALPEGDAAEYVKDLRQHFRRLRPTNGTRHGERRTFVFKNLSTADQVFVRHNAPGGTLQQPYDGPYKVVNRKPKTFVVHIRGRDVTVSIDRLKPAYIISEDEEPEKASSLPIEQRLENPPSSSTSLQPSVPSELDNPENSARRTDPPTAQEPTKTALRQTTRSGRRVRFPNRLQGGFS
ncbi:hypothetical protein ALC56_00331 [Trachymyrmex septentrionalis]|uniref:Pro-Pol polyprotein n=1 Tax=Trachymyrmex septentrionalis TaxID=34720 RepID=A0A151K1D1_9HYME|nr:hypothetical protein ALC56_00331 [Trachymyrmex septentrionalis]